MKKYPWPKELDFTYEFVDLGYGGRLHCTTPLRRRKCRDIPIPSGYLSY